jgi:hypothetical protein
MSEYEVCVYALVGRNSEVVVERRGGIAANSTPTNWSKLQTWTNQANNSSKKKKKTRRVPNGSIPTYHVPT